VAARPAAQACRPRRGHSCGAKKDGRKDVGKEADAASEVAAKEGGTEGTAACQRPTLKNK